MTPDAADEILAAAERAARGGARPGARPDRRHAGSGRILLYRLEKPIVLDADGLWALAGTSTGSSRATPRRCSRRTLASSVAARPAAPPGSAPTG